MTASSTVDQELGTRLFRIAAAIGRWRWTLVAALLLGGLAGVVGSFVVSPRYEASVRFIAESRTGAAAPSGLAGLAAPLGVPVTGAAERSPHFYQQLVGGDAILARLLADSLPTGTGSTASRRPLLELLRIRGPTSAARTAAGIRRLRRDIRPDVDVRSGIITVRVSMPSPTLAADVAGRVADLIDEFDRSSRRTRGGQRRVLMEERYREAMAAVRAVEDSLAAFLEANRRYEGSPMKILAEQRLRRRLANADELAQSLLRELETARVSEVDDRTAITITDAPRVPAVRAYPRRSRFALVGGLFAAATVAILVLTLESDWLAALRREWE